MSVPREKHLDEQAVAIYLNTVLTFPEVQIDPLVVNGRLVNAVMSKSFYEIEGEVGNFYVCVPAGNESDEEFKNRVRRAYFAHMAIFNLSHKIPNLATVQRNETIKHIRFHDETRETCTGFRISMPAGLKETYAQCLASCPIGYGDIATYTIFAQVVCTQVAAFEHCNHVHNKLIPSNIALLNYAPVFTVNYDTCSIICSKYIALILGYDASQFSYVTNERIVTSSPGRLYVNMEGHVSSDLYTFVFACLREAEAALKRVPKSSTETFVAMQQRKQIFEQLLEFYWAGPPSERPGNIMPYSTGPGFILHMIKIFKKSKLFCCLESKPSYSNVHCPALGSNEETLFSGDIHSLVLRKPVSMATLSEMDGTLGHRRPKERYSELCSSRAHYAFENISNDPEHASVTDFEIAVRELPVMLLLTKDVYARFVARDEIREHVTARAKKILETTVCIRNGTEWTVGSLLMDKQIKDDPVTDRIQKFE